MNLALIQRTACFLLASAISPASVSAGEVASAALTTKAPVTVHSFCNEPGCTDGFALWGGPVEGPDGAFYGTTFGGGDLTPYQGHTYGVGVVYRVTRAGRFTVLHQFQATTEGAYPEGSLSVGADGALYGTTSLGGASGGGSIFRITTTGQFSVLHQFGPGEGWSAYAPPVQDAAGNWYGTTLHGGSYDGGTVYRLAADGTFATLHHFTTWADGADPQGGLVFARDGNLYGTTLAGGNSHNAGTIFRITPSGTLTTLHSFSYSDGSLPEHTLAIGADGALYGTTSIGGPNGSFGTVFRISLRGSFTSIYAFPGVDATTSPTTALTRMPDGSFFGARATAGATQLGQLYRITTAGDYSDVYDFIGQGADGRYPEGDMVLGSDGALYGTTLDGGSNNDGAFFRLAVR